METRKTATDGVLNGAELHIMNNHEGVPEATREMRALLDGSNTLLVFLPTKTAEEISNVVLGKRSHNEDIEIPVLDGKRNEISRITFVVR